MARRPSHRRRGRYESRIAVGGASFASTVSEVLELATSASPGSAVCCTNGLSYPPCRSASRSWWRPGAASRIAVSVYALSVAALFGTSALDHRVDWRSLTARLWMRRLDHSMIFVLIAGTYTPFALVALHGPLALTSSSRCGQQRWWASGSTFSGRARRLGCTRCSTSRWAGLRWPPYPEVVAAIGVLGLTLVALGGVLYTLGAIVYSSRWRQRRPLVFDTTRSSTPSCCLAAAALQYAVIALWVAPN